MESMWSPFYAEIDPAKRSSLLKEIEAQGAASQVPKDELSLRKELLLKRFGTAYPDGHETDAFLRSILELIFLYDTARYFKRKARKDLRAVLGAFGLLEEHYQTEPGRTILYWEMVNAMRRYFATCLGEGYHRRFFGILPSSKEDQDDYTLQCAWNMSRGLSLRLGNPEEMALFEAAVEMAFAETGEKAREQFAAYDRLHSD